jgi:hypothetical protein
MVNLSYRFSSPRGDIIADDSMLRFVLDAALQGFFEALKLKEARGEMSGLSAAEVLQRMKSFDAGQLRSLVKRQLVDTGGSDFSDYMAVRRHLDDHASEIFAAIQSIAEPGKQGMYFKISGTEQGK